ncbi:uncharacterized protein [Argopecten irradians]|uniref:uncharacterized protein n=1 Tax=Argopecten irradians TaxID=31199 RepID=UPI00371092C1
MYVVVVYLASAPNIYKNANYERINEEISDTNWDEIIMNSNNINENWNTFKKVVKEIEESHVPTKIIKIGRNNKHSFPADTTTLEAIKKKHSLSRKAATTKDMNVRKEYNRVRNKVRKLTRRLRKEYEHNIAIKAKSDPKAIWNYIKSKSTSKSEIGELYAKPADKTSTKVTSNKGKAEVLCRFFSSVFIQESDTTPHLYIREVAEEMSQMNIEQEAVSKILKNLKPDKSPGLDELHPMFLKNTSGTISYPITKLFNQSISTGTLPG